MKNPTHSHRPNLPKLRTGLHQEEVQTKSRGSRRFWAPRTCTATASLGPTPILTTTPSSARPARCSFSKSTRPSPLIAWKPNRAHTGRSRTSASLASTNLTASTTWGLCCCALSALRCISLASSPLSKWCRSPAKGPAGPTHAATPTGPSGILPKQQNRPRCLGAKGSQWPQQSIAQSLLASTHFCTRKKWLPAVGTAQEAWVAVPTPSTEQLLVARRQQSPRALKNLAVCRACPATQLAFLSRSPRFLSPLAERFCRRLQALNCAPALVVA